MGKSQKDMCPFSYCKARDANSESTGVNFIKVRRHKKSSFEVFYVVLNCFLLINNLLVVIAGIIAHYRELLGDFLVVVCILIILLVDIVGITVLYWELLSDFWLWSVL